MAKAADAAVADAAVADAIADPPRKPEKHRHPNRPAPASQRRTSSSLPTARKITTPKRTKRPKPARATPARRQRPPARALDGANAAAGVGDVAARATKYRPLRMAKAASTSNACLSMRASGRLVRKTRKYRKTRSFRHRTSPGPCRMRRLSRCGRSFPNSPVKKLPFRVRNRLALPRTLRTRIRTITPNRRSTSRSNLQRSPPPSRRRTSSRKLRRHPTSRRAKVGGSVRSACGNRARGAGPVKLAIATPAPPIREHPGRAALRMCRFGRQLH